MIIDLRRALDHAQRHGVAIAAVNVPYFEGLLGTIRAAERTGAPVILQHAEGHEAVMAIEDIGPAMRALAERSPAAFVLHIDHATSLDYLERGFEVGFNSAMLDGSSLPFEENIDLTASAVRLAAERGFAVEGELGVMTGNENGDPSQGVAERSLFTDPRAAGEFVARSGVSALAASFGSVHGVYRQQPRIDFDLIEELAAASGVPLVMHGGSGLSPEVYRRSVAAGVRKVNYYTYAAKAALDALREVASETAVLLFPNAAVAATAAVEADVSSFITTLGTGDTTR